MDQGLKERLVGAAVLVAIGVWLIPWVLDGPENSIDSGGSSLQLPAVEEPMPMRTQTLRLDEGNEPAADAPARAAPSAAQSSATAATPTTEDPPTRETPRDTEATAPPSAEAPVTVAAVPPPKPAPATAGDWIVQLGTFSEEANARRLAQRAATFGYEVDVSNYRANGRTLYRVRVGPATTRAQADAKASALRAHGIDEARVVGAR
jgi:DedD protein